MKSEELLSVLVQLSKIDNYFTEFELTYLLKVGKHIGLEDSTVETLIQKNEVPDIQVPQEEKDRMTIIYYMLFLMKVDDKITEEEKELIHHYGFKLGFSYNMMDDFLNVMMAHQGKKVDQDALLTIIRKYQN